MNVRAALGLLPLLLVACDDPVAPPFTLVIAGPEQIVLIQDRYDDGTPRISCTVELEARPSGGHGDTEARWTGGTFIWRLAFSGSILQVDSLGSVEARDFWGGAVPVSTPRLAAWTFWAPEPFAIDMLFRYEVAGQVGSASYTLGCRPPAPPPAGTYRLVSVNGNPLPHPVAQWDSIHSASLTFYPNMTYIYSSRVQSFGQVYDQQGGIADFYGMPTADSLYLHAIAMGTGGGYFHRSGTSLTFLQVNCCGRPDYLWRYTP